MKDKRSSSTGNRKGWRTPQGSNLSNHLISVFASVWPSALVVCFSREYWRMRTSPFFLFFVFYFLFFFSPNKWQTSGGEMCSAERNVKCQSSTPQEEEKANWIIWATHNSNSDILLSFSVPRSSRSHSGDIYTYRFSPKVGTFESLRPRTHVRGSFFFVFVFSKHVFFSLWLKSPVFWNNFGHRTPRHVERTPNQAKRWRYYLETSRRVDQSEGWNEEEMGRYRVNYNEAAVAEETKLSSSAETNKTNWRELREKKKVSVFSWIDVFIISLNRADSFVINSGNRFYFFLYMYLFFYMCYL